MWKAMYACLESELDNVGSHTDILSRICDGKQGCSATACEDTFGVAPVCKNGIEPKLWVTLGWDWTSENTKWW